jgi:GAF domain-containing protein
VSSSADPGSEPIGSHVTTTRLLEAVREFTSTILNPYDLQELLQRLTEHATRSIDGEGAGVMLVGRDGLAFAAASNEAVVEIEALQGRVEEGACHHAFTADEVVVVEDLAATDRWPNYRERALGLGLHAVMGCPMRAWGQKIGVLNVYRAEPGPWSAEDIEATEILTAMGAGYVLHANQLRAQHELADQLQTALESRDTIGQAKGVLMARHGVDAEAAFKMLRDVSQRSNVKLRDVAARIVAGDPEDGR